MFLCTYAAVCAHLPLWPCHARVLGDTLTAAMRFPSSTRYWLTGLAANFFVLTFVVALLGMVASSTSLLIGAVAESVQVAMQLTPLLFVPQLVRTDCPARSPVRLGRHRAPHPVAALFSLQLFAGFFIPITSIPVWLRWAQYLCSLKYSLNLLVVVEFENLPSSWPSAYSSDKYYDAVCELPRRGAPSVAGLLTCVSRVLYRADGCSGADLVDGECVEAARVGNEYDSALFPRSEVSVNDVGFYLAILCGALVFFRVLALIALVFKARRH